MKETVLTDETFMWCMLAYNLHKDWRQSVALWVQYIILKTGFGKQIFLHLGGWYWYYYINVHDRSAMLPCQRRPFSNKRRRAGTGRETPPNLTLWYRLLSSCLASIFKGTTIYGKKTWLTHQFLATKPLGRVRVEADEVLSWAVRCEAELSMIGIVFRQQRLLVGACHFNVHSNFGVGLQEHIWPIVPGLHFVDTCESW